MEPTFIDDELYEKIKMWDYGTIGLDAKSFVRDDLCAICGSPWVEMHHIFPGPNRKKSEKYSLKIPLCRQHHQEMHMFPNQGLDLLWKKSAQAYFEKYWGTRTQFIWEFGKSWLD